MGPLGRKEPGIGGRIVESNLNFAILVSFAVGVLVTIAPFVVFDILKNRRDRRAIASAIVAEIIAIVELTRLRGDVDAIRHLLHSVEKGQAGTLPVLVDANLPLDPVYDYHLPQIGLLGPSASKLVVQFYRLVRNQRFEIANLNQKAASRDETIKTLNKLLTNWRLVEDVAEQVVLELGFDHSV